MTHPTTNGASTSASNVIPIAADTLTSIPQCIAAFAQGAFLIVLDSPSRENEGDLIIAAAHLTTPKSAFLIRHTSGYLCAPMSAERARALDLDPMVPMDRNSDPNRTNYYTTVDAVGGHEGPSVERLGKGEAQDGKGDVTTGISAHDRAVTCRVLADEDAGAERLRRPGHVVPLVARRGGVRERRGHTEAGWEFCRLVGLQPEVAVIGELVVDGEEEAGRGDGEGEVGGEGNRKGRRPEYVGSGMMRAAECVEFGRKWGIPVCTIEDLVAYVEEREGRLDSSVNGP